MQQQIEHINTAKLIPYANNSRTHSAEQIAQVAASIQEFGFTNPVLIDGKNEIIAGHGRVLAAQSIHLENVPCLRLDHLSEAQKRAYVIADNKLALNAGWDMDVLKDEMLELQELDELLFIEPETDPNALDNVPNSTEKTVSKRGDIWLLDHHRVMCGDSTSAADVDRLLDTKKIDLIFSDPPYGVSYASKNKFLNAADKGNRNQNEIINDHMSVDETGALWAAVFALWTSRMAEYSSYYISSPQGGDLLMMMMMMNANGFPLKHTLIWNKNNHVLGRTDYNYKHEPILYGWVNKHKFYGRGKFNKSVWDIAKPLKNDLHPTMKPVELVENCILNSSKLGHIIGDMFLGSGTTVIAAELHGRHCYGMELSENYIDVIIKRWQMLTGKQATHAETGKTFDSLLGDL